MTRNSNKAARHSPPGMWMAGQETSHAQCVTGKILAFVHVEFIQRHLANTTKENVYAI